MTSQTDTDSILSFVKLDELAAEMIAAGDYAGARLAEAAADGDELARFKLAELYRRGALVRADKLDGGLAR